MKNEKNKPQIKGDLFRITNFSRRQFLKRASVTAVGALASVSLSSSCKASISTFANPTTSVNPTSGVPTVSSASISSTSTVPQISRTPPATSPSTVAGYSYVPPTTLPVLITVVGTDCTVATDRSYSIDNIWVKSLSADTVAVGITTTMVEIIYQPYNISLSPVGTTLAKEDDFGAIEGYKLSADLTSPVSGTVIEINNSLIELSKSNVIITPINDDPYNSGWLIIVRLSNPAELNSLLSPQSYMALPQVSNGRATGIA